MIKNRSKNAFSFYKLQFEKANKGKIFNKGITDVTVAALDSWRVNGNLSLMFFCYCKLFGASDNDTTAT